MAHYTITIKTLKDNGFDFKMTNYPIFDENYRNTLNNNILNHYYENEIGFETAPLFRFYLNQKLNEIMPKYNVLYLAQKKLIDENLLFSNVNINEKYNGKNDATTSSNSNSTSNSNGLNKSKNLYQNTPQGQLDQTDIDNASWATDLTLDKNETNNTINDKSNNNGSANNVEEYIKSITGSNGGKYNIDILNDIKNNIMNIDLMIIDELYDLFMQIF